MSEFAPGLPDKANVGDLKKLPVGKLLQYVAQEHQANKAGLHTDIRFGNSELGLYSWASRKGVPAPGDKRLAVRQPLHTSEYADFQGTIPSGYGAGTVKTKDKGSVMLTHVSNDKINFVVTHKKNPEYFTMVPTGDKNWLMINTTPQDTDKFLGQAKPAKIKMVSVPASHVETLLAGNHDVQEKIDGAYQLFKLYKDKIEAISHRESASGGPIIHTQRIGLTGVKPLDTLPPELVGTILQGETFGVGPDGKAIPPHELGGLLNSSVEKSLKTQADRGIQLKNAIFAINGEHDPARLEQVIKHLPKNFILPLSAGTSDNARRLWDSIVDKTNPLTHEGIIAWPKNELGGGRPSKVKVLPETDVVIKRIFPGAGKYTGSHAGGFEYAHVGSDKIVGKVGTGFSDEIRKDMLENPDSYINRIARVRSMGEHTSRSLRAPSFLALHEDYSGVKTASRRSVHDDLLETVSDVGNYAWDHRHKFKRKKKQGMTKTAFIKEENGQYFVHSEKGKKLSRGYASKAEAAKRLGQIEYFKHQGEKQASATLNAVSHNAANLGMAVRSLLKKKSDALNNAQYAIKNPYSHHTKKELDGLGDVHPLKAFIASATDNYAKNPRLAENAELAYALRTHPTQGVVREAKRRLGSYHV